jgi:hypothetical protein
MFVTNDLYSATRKAPTRGMYAAHLQPRENVYRTWRAEPELLCFEDFTCKSFRSKILRSKSLLRSLVSAYVSISYEKRSKISIRYSPKMCPRKSFVWKILRANPLFARFCAHNLPTAQYKPLVFKILHGDIRNFPNASGGYPQATSQPDSSVFSRCKLIQVLYRFSHI